MAFNVNGSSTRLIFVRFLFLFHVSMLFPCCLSIGSDTILTGQSLFSTQTMISREGKFELGFFDPTDSSFFDPTDSSFFPPATDSNQYVGIWYKNIPRKTVVWVANRNSPIISSLYKDYRVELSDGNLYVNSDESERIVLVRTLYATEAVLLDTGNFILRNASGILWQSFDNPTDTWLPDGKIGFRWFPDIEAKLVSWSNPTDPTMGPYSLELQGRSELFIWRNDTQLFQGIQVLEGGTFTPLLPKPNRNIIYNFSYVSRGDSMYLVFNGLDDFLISRIVMHSNGVLMLYIWLDHTQDWVIYWAQPSDFCKSFAGCGGNAICDITTWPPCRCLPEFVPRSTYSWELHNFSGGCMRQYPSCNPENYFRKLSNIKLRGTSAFLEVGKSDICKRACSVNCSCNAYAYHNNEGQCLLFMEDISNLEILPNNSTGRDLYVRSSAQDPKKGKGKGNVPAVALAVPITCVILVCTIFLCYCWRKLKSKVSTEAYQNLLLLDLNSNGKTKNKQTSVGNSSGDEKNNNYELPVFSFSSIVAATNNFSITNKLGQGGFGPVYKGELLNKQFVAVKRLSRKSGQGLEEFKNETELIAKLQHRNLVGIVGCCIENDEKILVYEYMPNNSLDFSLFEPTGKELLDWRKRVHIIEGIAQGLLYLHHYSRLRIVHRDLKASNILLDAEMNPKISDFGMAKIFGRNDSQADTSRIVGTYGYMSPEYATKGIFSVKSDVFAFGVLLLEIISGKKNTGFYGSEYLSLLGYVWNMWKHNRVLELIDPALEVPSASSFIPLRYIQIGLLCVQENPAERPTMPDVVAMINNEQTSLASPKDPAFIFGRNLVKSIPRQTKVDICSVNGLTVSMMEAR